MEKEGWRGVRLGGKKIHSLAYVDDLAEDDEGMKEVKLENGKTGELLRQKGTGAGCTKNESDEVEREGRSGRR